MLKQEFQDVYDVFKMVFYKSLCKDSEELSMLEAFSLDVIHMLGHPTILEYAKYLGISQPNATYRVNQMINKGYLTKEVSPEDKRAYRLEVTDKFTSLYRDNDKFIKEVLTNVENTYSKEEIAILEKMLREVKEEIYKEIK